MSKILIRQLLFWINDVITSFVSSVIFYTMFPLPSKWTTNWIRVARWAPIIGIVMGWGLGLGYYYLGYGGIPNLTRSALTIALWVVVTGGLHLDGVMDAADGLAVTNPERRLEVMRDSTTGAFGAIAGLIVLLLKVVALSELGLPSWWVLPLVAGWARWGQVLAIASYPYLRATGKGSFHQEHLRLPQDILLGLLCLLGWSYFGYWLGIFAWPTIGLINLLSMAISWVVGYWFYHQLGGHTGDTYGAVVEWSEALILCWLTVF